MNSTDEWTYETIEVPASVLWKRTLLLTFISVGIGLGVGYLVGRSVSPEESARFSLGGLMPQFRMPAPPPAMDHESPIRTDQVWQAPQPDSLSTSKIRPTFMTLDDESTLQTGKG
jgi:hypothetical protein